MSDAFLSQDKDGKDILNKTDGSWLELAPVQAAAIEIFSLPRTLGSGVATLRKRHPDLDPADAQAVVIELIEGAIIALHSPASPTAQAAKPPPAGMFGCPMTTLEEAVSGEASKVVLLGMPYELGITGREGTRTGPSYFRRSSRISFDYVEKGGHPNGWWDSARQRHVLEGVRLRDIGDIPCAQTARNGQAFERLHDTIVALLRAGRFPVTIGGDHSISLPIITAVASLNPGLGIIHFDAHPDIGDVEDLGDWKRNCTHGNFMTWVASNPNVSSITQFGLRHLLPSPPFSSPKLTRYPGNAFVERIEEIVAALPNDRPYYLTFDVDCLDPTLISQTGTPIPGGLEYREAIRALEQISKRLNLVGMDVVELIGSPEGGLREGATAAYLVFEVLANLFARETR